MKRKAAQKRDEHMAEARRMKTNWINTALSYYREAADAHVRLARIFSRNTWRRSRK